MNDYIDIPENILNNTNISLNVLSDLIRVNLLEKYGGVWADATLFCNRPLNDWLYKYINHEIFMFKYPVDNIRSASWFIYSCKDNYLITSLYRRLIDSLDTCNEYPYFIFHYLFNTLYDTDIKIQTIWNNMPTLAGDGITGPFYLQQQGLFTHTNDIVKSNINSKIIPVYKLTYKIDFSQYNNKTILYYLYSTISNKL